MQVSESLQKGFLRNVLRILRIAQERHRHGEDGALVGANEVMEETRIAGEDGSDDLRLYVPIGRLAHRQMGSLRRPFASDTRPTIPFLPKR